MRVVTPRRAGTRVSGAGAGSRSPEPGDRGARARRQGKVRALPEYAAVWAFPGGPGAAGSLFGNTQNARGTARRPGRQQLEHAASGTRHVAPRACA